MQPRRSQMVRGISKAEGPNRSALAWCSFAGQSWTPEFTCSLIHPSDHWKGLGSLQMTPASITFLYCHQQSSCRLLGWNQRSKVHLCLFSKSRCFSVAAWECKVFQPIHSNGCWELATFSRARPSNWHLKGANIFPQPFGRRIQWIPVVIGKEPMLFQKPFRRNQYILTAIQTMEPFCGYAKEDNGFLSASERNLRSFSISRCSSGRVDQGNIFQQLFRTSRCFYSHSEKSYHIPLNI